MSTKLCLLCEKNKVFEIKSHLTPAKITENTYGKRGEEEIYTVDPSEKTLDKYYGPSHKQTNDTSIKIAPNSRKGIFCKDCETALGVFESEVQNKLLAKINALGKGEYKVDRTAEGIKFIEVDIHENLLITFFQSVVWRQCVEQTLDGMTSPLPSAEQEKLRKEVYENIHTSIKDIKKKDLSGSQPMTVFTTYCTDSKKVATYANPHPRDTNPLLFMSGAVDLFYWRNPNITVEIGKLLSIDPNLLSDKLNIIHKRIAILSSSDWRKIHKLMASIVADQYLS
jgi:hypothetical protein